jgi:hypothetical protein
MPDGKGRKSAGIDTTSRKLLKSLTSRAPPLGTTSDTNPWIADEAVR